MFDKTWRWAGTFRKTEKNVGVPWAQITVSLRQLFDDTKYWIENRTLSADEIAARFHHRLVAIHAFPNGNGRHARVMTELLQRQLQVAPFTWGRYDLQNESDVRSQYIHALRVADGGDLRPLLEFLRSDSNANSP